MPKSCSSFSSKPWITTTIANTIKSKTKIYKKFHKEKNPQEIEIYGGQFQWEPSYDVTKNYKGLILQNWF